MANFEYYLQMYSRQRENRYQQAMELAYRDLMLEYKNELMARQALEEQIQLQQQLQSKLQLQFVKSLNKKDGDQLTAYQIAQLQQGANQLNFKQREKIYNAFQDIPNDINKQYEIPAGINSAITEVMLNIYTKDTVQGITALMKEKGVLADIPNLTPKQKEQFAAEYIPLLVGRLSTPEINKLGGTQRAAAQKLATGFGLGPYIERGLLEQNKRKQINDAKKEAEKFLFIPTGLRKTAETAGISEDQLKNAIAFAIPETSAIVEPTLTDDIPLPTGDLLRARAAEYYAPFASEQFQQKVAAAKEPAAAEEPVKPEVSKQQINQDALAGLPEYAGKMFRAAGAVGKIIDLDEDTFRDQATTAQQTAALLIPNIKEGRSNYETAVQQIEQEFDKPEEIEQALAVLGANLLREFRKQKITTPNLEDIASQPGRNK